MHLADPISRAAPAAGVFAQIAALLAAVAFANLWFYLTRPRPDRGAALALLSALIAFVVAAVLYAIGSGGSDSSPASYLGLLIDGGVFLLGLLAMLHALAQVLPGVRAIPVVIGPAVGLLLIGTLFQRPGSGFSWSDPFGLGVGLALSLLLISLIVYWRLPAGPGWAAGPAVVVGVGVAAAVIAAVWLLAQPSSFAPSDALTSTVLVTAFAALACFSLLTAVAPSAWGTVPVGVAVPVSAAVPVEEGPGIKPMAKEDDLPVAGSPPPVAYTQPPSSYGTSRERAEVSPSLGVALAVVVALVAAGQSSWTLFDTALGLFSLGLLATSIRASVAGLRTPMLWVVAGAGGFSLTVMAAYFLQLWSPDLGLPSELNPLTDVLLPATWLVATLLVALVLHLMRRGREVKRSVPVARPTLAELPDATVVLSDGPTIAINLPANRKD
jgi:hypothetical protein